MKMIKNFALALTAVAGLTMAANAATAGAHPKQVEWQFEGPFGTFDKASAQRGFQVFKQVCASCHSLKYFKFRNLAALGYEEDMIKAFAAEYEVPGEPDEFGEPTMIKALPQHGIPAPFANENAARASNGGALPPDLSLIIKARHDGANYLYSLMTGYEDAPADVSVTPGKSYNPYFKGGQIGMAQPLSDDIVEYEDGTKATQDQMARDVVNFLTFVAEPHLEQSHAMGLNVILFLLVLTIILYFSMKKVWKPVKEGKHFD